MLIQFIINIVFDLWVHIFFLKVVILEKTLNIVLPFLKVGHF